MIKKITPFKAFMAHFPPSFAYYPNSTFISSLKSKHQYSSRHFLPCNINLHHPSAHHLIPTLR